MRPPLGLWLLVTSVFSNLLGLALPLALLQVYDRILPTAQYGTAVSLLMRWFLGGVAA